jgi:CheY-like chemotaxis protein
MFGLPEALVGASRVSRYRSNQWNVEIAGRESSELILMDLAMPEIDGLVPRSEYAHRRICATFAISACGELGIDVQFKVDRVAVGFNAYLPEPFAPAKLFDLVDRYLPKSRGASPDEKHL